MLIALSDLIERRNRDGLNWPKKQTVYLWIYEDREGFSHCISRLGRKILIDDQKFEEWLLSASTKGDAHAKN